MSLLDEYSDNNPQAGIAFSMAKLKYMKGGMTSDEAELRVEMDLKNFIEEQDNLYKVRPYVVGEKRVIPNDTSTSEAS